MGSANIDGPAQQPPHHAFPRLVYTAYRIEQVTHTTRVRWRGRCLGALPFPSSPPRPPPLPFSSLPLFSLWTKPRLVFWREKNAEPPKLGFFLVEGTQAPRKNFKRIALFFEGFGYLGRREVEIRIFELKVRWISGLSFPFLYAITVSDRKRLLFVVRFFSSYKNRLSSVWLGGKWM